MVDQTLNLEFHSSINFFDPVELWRLALKTETYLHGRHLDIFEGEGKSIVTSGQLNTH